MDSRGKKKTNKNCNRKQQQAQQTTTTTTTTKASSLLTWFAQDPGVVLVRAGGLVPESRKEAESEVGLAAGTAH